MNNVNRRTELAEASDRIPLSQRTASIKITLYDD